MKSAEKILSDFSKNAGGFLSTSHDWRRESALMYAIRDSRPLASRAVGGAWGLADSDDPDYSRRNSEVDNNRALTVVSIAPAYMRAIIGMLTQTRKTFTAQSLDPEFDKEIDAMGDAMEWVTSVSRFDAKYALALEDAVYRGVGATVRYLDFSRKQHPAGYPTMQVCDFLYFDRGGMNDLSADTIAWCGYAEPMNREDLEEYIESKGGIKKVGGAGFREQMLQYVSVENEADIEFLYHYFWREYTTVHDVENFWLTKAQEITPFVEQNPQILEYIGQFAEKHQLDLQRANFWVLDKEAYADYKTALEFLKTQYGLEFENLFHGQRQAQCYYRAQIANGGLILSSQSYTQDCHPMNIITAFYDRASGCFYGLSRAAAYVQELINNSMSDFATYGKRVTSGGNVALVGMGTELARSIQNIRDQEQAFPLPTGARIQGIGTPDAGATLQALSAMTIDLIPMVLGVPKEILGMVASDTPAASLYKMLTQQMQISLSHILNSADAYLWNEGCITRDIVLELVNNLDGFMVLPRISPVFGQEGQFQLSRQNIARSYSMMLSTKDTSGDQKHDEFMKLSEFMGNMPAELQQVMFPKLVKMSSFDEEIKQDFEQAFAPQQPVQPDPMAMELQQAQIDLVKSQAADLAASAAKKDAEAKKIVASLNMADEQAIADVYKTVSEIELNKSKSGQPQMESII